MNVAEPQRKHIHKDERHSHYWIEDGELYESYHTIRGLRYRLLFEVGDLPDTDRCTPELIRYIESEFLN